MCNKKVLGPYVFAILASLAGAGFGCERSQPARKEPSQKPELAKLSKGEREALVAEARELGQAFTAVAQEVSPTVVSIRVESMREDPHSSFDFFGFGRPTPPGGGIRRGNGSGVIIRADGYVLTNNHVVQDATRIEVLLQDDRRFPGEVVGTDPSTDLAVVRIEAKELPAAGFAEMENVRVGEWVLAIGSPFGLDYSVTAGVVSALGRGNLGMAEIEDYLQTDASINPGNSGGPLVDLQGNVVGINTMIVGRGTGIGFAVPADLAQNVSDQIIETGGVQRAWIGVSFQEVTPRLAKQLALQDAQGALVSGVVPGGPAAKAGLEPGDVIVAVDDRSVEEGRDLLRAVLRKRIGEEVQLKVIRDGEEITKPLSTAERPTSGKVAAAPPQPRSGAPAVGLRLQKLTPQLAERLNLDDTQGVLVAAVVPGSAAERAGLKAGDVIVAADRKMASSPADVDRAFADGTALLRIKRGGGALFIVVSKD